MARGQPVELATRTFDKKGDATAFFREILNRYQSGDRVNNDDSLDLSALLERHTEYAEKVGCGISHFEIMMTGHGTKCFRIVRLDGTGTDFSYPHCISQRPPSRKQEVSNALRWAIRYDLYAARDKFFAAHADEAGFVACAETGERISREQAHMDHRPPMTFEVIVTTFLASKGLSLNDVPLSKGRDDQVSPEVTDEDMAEAFRDYHTNVARLDFVKSSINLAQSSRNRLKLTRVNLNR
ncbi:DCL family protein [uncultured Sneathiella sp.]|jgi:hypothetical protein|uniref:DCL family protein n=1 Tax=uncultured Sneathiella sp. TaxID=879315 RepID=UPI0030D6F31B|tara:strand:- start:22574 stop:23290 length:717 start_codon:yes stop_codon:yes gene_type:complete